jgi:hypothetical protein
LERFSGGFRTKDGRRYLVDRLNGAAKLLAIATDQQSRGETV